MATYHLYFLHNGTLVGSDEIEAADDGEAAAIAGRRSDGRAVEIWNDYRRLRILNPADASAEIGPVAPAALAVGAEFRPAHRKRPRLGPWLLRE